MLVPGLQTASLSKTTSGSKLDYPRVYESLCKCAQEMRDKYSQQQIHTEKLRVKIKAVNILLHELRKVPEDSGTTCETILFALKSHAEALQGHEHLLSRKGNTYALLEQTSGLRERHGDARASLLRYHDLKNKLLGPDTPLNPELKEAVSTLTKDKFLTLQMLVALDRQFGTEETTRPTYVYGNRSFPVQDSLNSRLLGNIECFICKNIMNQPREICRQNHLICLECSRVLARHKVTNCPNCRSTLFAEFKQNIPLGRLIGNLQVRCCHADCGSIIEISEIKSHLDSCGEEEVECPHKCTDEGTGEVLRMPRKQLADHSKECPKLFKCNMTSSENPYSGAQLEELLEYLFPEAQAHPQEITGHGHRSL